MTSPRVKILGCELDRVDMQDAVRRCRELIDARTGAQHMSVNAAKLVALRTDLRMRQIVRDSDLVTADGMPVVWASRLLGDPLPMRVAGIDLMSKLLALAEENHYSVYILGARQEVLERAIARICKQHPRIQIAGYRNGYFSNAESEAIVRDIHRANPDILFVAMSSPRKEYWLADYGERLRVPLAMGVGGSIDVWAGIARRAPKWMRRAGLEWSYRLLQEPRRLWKRYLISNTKFTLLLVRELTAKWLRSPMRSPR